jgi:hypothetical protein
MALPSQSARAGTLIRGAVTRKRRYRQRRPLIALGGLVVVAIVIVLIVWSRWPGGRQPEDGVAENDGLALQGEGAPQEGDSPFRIETGRGLVPGEIGDGAPIQPALGADEGSEDTSGTAQGGSPGTESVRTPTPPADDTQAAPVSVSSMLLTRADEMLRSNDPIGARALLNAALRDGRVAPGEAAQVRAKLGEINEDLIFGPRVVAGDSLVGTHTIGSGDYLSTLPRKLGLAIDWRLLAKINRLSNPNNVGMGQTVKIVYGPFHAVVTKSAYRMDVYVGPPGDTAQWTFVRSFDVGIGADDGTPVGEFVVKENSKLVNPRWKNPRTGEVFGADDPANPIGERWIGLEGIGESVAWAGYGIHGTIDPQSIGGQMSMGCVRMRPDDVSLVYSLLVEGVSEVRILP